MSNILFKQVQDNTVATPPNPGYIKLFSNINDSGNLYYKDSNGNSFIVGTSGPGAVSQVTYAGLSTLVSSNGLTPGMLYEITDYQTVYDRPNYYFDATIKGTISTVYGATESLIVTALNTSTLDTHAFQPNYPLDSIKYDFNFTNTELNSTTAFGRITERIDEYGNRTDYDHRQVTYIRYQSYKRSSQLSGKIININLNTGILTGNGSTLFNSELSTGQIYLLDTFNSFNYNFGIKITNIVNDQIAEFLVDPDKTSNISGSFDIYSSASTDYYEWKESYVGQEIDGTYTELKTFQTDGESPVVSINNYIGDSATLYFSGGSSHILPNIVMYSGSYNNKIGFGSYNNTFPFGSIHNDLGFNFSNNYIYSILITNKIGHNFQSNIIFNNFSQNSFESNCQFNQIGTLLTVSSFEQNTIQSNFTNNKIILSFLYNRISRDFTANQIEGNFMGNEIGFYFNGNIIALNFGFDPGPKEVKGNKIGDQFTSNVIGTIGSVNANFWGNKIGNKFSGNNLDSDFQNNQIKDSFQSNNIKTNFLNNNIGFFCISNTIENNFISNIIGNGFDTNVIADNFGYDIYSSLNKGNEIGDNFSKNFIGTIGSIPADFWGNKIGNCFGVDTSGSATGNSIQGTFTDNMIGEHFYNNVIFSGFESNSIGNRFGDNLLNASFYGNKIGNDFSTNITDVNFSYNTVNDECQTNTFGLDCLDNNFGSLCVLNTIGDYFQYNKIGSFCSNNTIGATASNNDIGDEFSYNTIGLGLKHNKIGNKFLGNTIGDDFLSNEIGNFFGALNAGVANGNFILNTFAYNKIGNYFGNDGNWTFGSGTDGGNIVGDNFTHNKIGNNTIFNGFAFDFRRNTIGNEFWFNVFNVAGVVQDNFFGNLFVSNTGSPTFPVQMGVLDFRGNRFSSSTGFNLLNGSNFISNLLGVNFESNNLDSCNYNSVGNGFIGNTINDGFEYNHILDDFESNTIGVGFLGNNIGSFFKSNQIQNNMTRNNIGNTFQSNIISTTGAGFTLNTITSNVVGFDFASGPSTYVYGNYNVTIFWNSTPALALSYYNGANTLTAVTPITF